MDAARLVRCAGRIADLLLDLVYPPGCLVCGEDDPAAPPPLCGPCRVTIVPIGRRGCRKCGAEPTPGARPGPPSCGRCRGRGFRFRRAVAGVRYGGATREVVLAMKFSCRREGIAVLADALARGLSETHVAARVGVVVPVPLHPWRRLGRGFDQAETLAREVARRIGRPLVTGALRRRRLTPAQARRAPGERRVAMAGAFAPGWRSRAVRGRAVLLVDDVLTSGATADAAARTLLAAGARVVDVGVGAT